MDNICHSLIGGALSRAGFDRKTPLATATMIIGANIPDVDALAVFGSDSFGIRRGITHGIPALFLWPFVLTGLVLIWDRFIRRRRNPFAAPAIPVPLLFAAAVSVFTHPFFDWLNTYGMRWLMPIRNEWFYGDSLFIVDVWLWLSLGAGFILAKRLSSPRPAQIAVAFAALYVGFMVTTSRVIEARVRRETGVSGAPRSMMVAPIPVNPFARDLLIVQNHEYRRGRTSLLSDRIEWGETIAINRHDPAARLALTDPQVASFVHWARFPFFVVTAEEDRTFVRISDARYSDTPRGGWASVRVEVRTPDPAERYILD